MLSLHIALPLGVAARAAAVEVLLCSRVEIEREAPRRGVDGI